MKKSIGYNERRFRTFEHIGGDYYYESEEVKNMLECIIYLCM